MFLEYHLLPDMSFHGHYLIKNNIFISKRAIHLYISYTVDPQLRNWNRDFALGNCLFGSVKLTKNVNLDKYKYSDKYTGYRIGFDCCLEFLFTDGSYGKMSLLLELMWIHLCMLIIREKIF